MNERSASTDEAVAIAAAVERFLADTVPAAAPDRAEEPSPWGRAALLEGVSARNVTIQNLEGGMR